MAAIRCSEAEKIAPAITAGATNHPWRMATDKSDWLVTRGEGTQSHGISVQPGYCLCRPRQSCKRIGEPQ